MDYCAEVLRRFDSPPGAGKIGSDAPGLVAAEAEDRTLNVWIRFQVQVEDGVIRDVRFQAFGCPHTIAAASYAADWLRGRPAAALRQLDVGRVGRDLAVPTEKLGKLLRIEDALALCSDRIAAEGVDGRRTG
jgi:NifU-like protein involved in Fe-S cluster formation